jgi:hypothetical protein
MDLMAAVAPRRATIGGLGVAVKQLAAAPCFGKDKEVLECSGRRLLSAPQPKKSAAGSPLITIAAAPLVAELIAPHNSAPRRLREQERSNSSQRAKEEGLHPNGSKPNRNHHYVEEKGRVSAT